MKWRRQNDIDDKPENVGFYIIRNEETDPAKARFGRIAEVVMNGYGELVADAFSEAPIYLNEDTGDEIIMLGPLPLPPIELVNPGD